VPSRRCKFRYLVALCHNPGPRFLVCVRVLRVSSVWHVQALDAAIAHLNDHFLSVRRKFETLREYHLQQKSKHDNLLESFETDLARVRAPSQNETTEEASSGIGLTIGGPPNMRGRFTVARGDTASSTAKRRHADPRRRGARSTLAQVGRGMSKQCWFVEPSASPLVPRCLARTTSCILLTEPVACDLTGL
jgi:hypothetical protein